MQPGDVARPSPTSRRRAATWASSRAPASTRACPFVDWFRRHQDLTNSARTSAMPDYDPDRFWTAELDEHRRSRARRRTRCARRSSAWSSSASRASKRAASCCSSATAAVRRTPSTRRGVRSATGRTAADSRRRADDRRSALTAIGNDSGSIDSSPARSRRSPTRRRRGRDLHLRPLAQRARRARGRARRGELTAAAFTGRGGGAVAALADPCLIVPSDTTARIQEMHIALGQMLCGAVERALGSRRSARDPAARPAPPRPTASPARACCASAT